jgi:predicted TIM-barrel fold metal-dependent hydrolase
LVAPFIDVNIRLVPGEPRAQLAHLTLKPKPPLALLDQIGGELANREAQALATYIEGFWLWLHFVPVWLSTLILSPEPPPIPPCPHPSRGGERNLPPSHVRGPSYMVGGVAPLVDCNVHLWDQAANPIFWLTDRTLVRDMLGNYDSLPDTYTLADYRREVAGHDVRGIVWSDAGAADPIAAAGWAQGQCEELGVPGALVTLGDPADQGFAELVERFRVLPLARSVRVRLVPALAQGAAGTLLDDEGAMANLELLAEYDLVATLEAAGDQLDVVADLARALPGLRIVLDHFGWPQNPNDGLEPHRERLSAIAAAPNTATRIDAIGTIFGDWTADGVRPWLRAATDTFGPERCMLGSDLPIERLRSGFGRLYDAYQDIFSDLTDGARDALFAETAKRWYHVAA